MTNVRSAPTDSPSDFFSSCIQLGAVRRSFDHLLSEVATSISSTFNAQYASIWVPHPCGTYLNLAHTTLTSDAAHAISRPQSLDTRAGQCFKTAQPIYYRLDGPSPPCATVSHLKHLNCTATWCVPIKAAAHAGQFDVVAIATIDGDVDRMRKEVASPLLESIGCAVWSLIELRLATEQADLVERLLAAADMRDSDLRSTLDDMASQICDIVGFEACTVFVADEGSRSLSVTGTTGIASRTSRYSMNYHFGEYSVGTAATTRGTVAVDLHLPSDDPDTDPYPDRVDNPDRPSTLLVAPVLARSGQLLGAVRLRNKLVTSSSVPPRLNYLDQLRITQVARVVSPTLQIMMEHSHQDLLLQRVRHDLLVPATMIRNFAQVFRAKSDAELIGQLAYLRRGLANCETSSEMIILLCDLKLIMDDASVSPDLVPTDISGEITKLATMFAGMCRRSGVAQISIDADSFRALPVLSVDPRLLRIALSKLLHNAIKFSYQGTTIRVHAQVTDAATARISIENNGIGVAPDDSARIFDAYFTTEAARGVSHSGLGMGLYVARSIAEQHGGDVVLARPSSPTVFVLQLPIGDSSEAKS